jgi:hypothetical protein
MPAFKINGGDPHRGNPTYAPGPNGPTPQGTAVDPGARRGKPNDKERTVPHSWGMTDQQKDVADLGGMGHATQAGGGVVLPASDLVMSHAYATKSRPLGRNAPLKQSWDSRVNRSRVNDVQAGGDPGANIKSAPTLDLNTMANAVHDDALNGSLFHDRQAHALPGTVKENT